MGEEGQRTGPGGVAVIALAVAVLVFLIAPVVIIATHAIKDRHHRLDNETLILGAILQLYYVRCAIYFGCLGIFMKLLRGALEDRRHRRFQAQGRLYAHQAADGNLAAVRGQGRHQ